MSDHAHHCPFLNRSDRRCASHFSLNGLGEALDQCFGEYGGCGVYRELLRERRIRRGELPGRDGSAWPAAGGAQPERVSTHASPIVPLTRFASSSSRHGAH